MDGPPAEHVLAVLHRLSGRRLKGGADKLVGADHGVTGWDGIDLLEDLEEHFDVDLRPFMDARATTRKGRFRTRTVFGDAAPRELAEHIGFLRSHR